MVMTRWRVNACKKKPSLAVLVKVLTKLLRVKAFLFI